MSEIFKNQDKQMARWDVSDFIKMVGIVGVVTVWFLVGIWGFTCFWGPTISEWKGYRDGTLGVYEYGYWENGLTLFGETPHPDKIVVLEEEEFAPGKFNFPCNPSRSEFNGWLSQSMNDSSLFTREYYNQVICK